MYLPIPTYPPTLPTCLLYAYYTLANDDDLQIKITLSFPGLHYYHSNRILLHQSQISAHNTIINNYNNDNKT